jgi:SNF2 family DNA or RNA helicase
VALKVTFWKGVFVADHAPSDEILLKRAGFEAHEPTTCDSPVRCRACRAKIGRRFWSSRVEDATKLKSYCLPPALEAMSQHLRKLTESRATDAKIVVPAPPGLSYRPYQRACVAYAVQRKDTWIGDDMGLGKTVEAIGFANYVRPSSILIVAPVTLSLNWLEEATKWLCEPYRPFVPKTSSSRVPDEANLVITNYEKVIGRPVPVVLAPIGQVSLSTTAREDLDVDAAVARCEKKKNRKIVVVREGSRYTVVRNHADFLAMRRLGWATVPLTVLPDDRDPRSLKTDKIYVDTPLSACLKARVWGLGIFDEAHALKNPDAQRSASVLGPGGLYERCKRTLFLTGTPVENRPVEMWPIASKLCPSRFGDWWDFARRYCGLHLERRGRGSVWVADGDTNHSELQQRLRTSILIRRTKEQVLKELPPKCRQLVVLEDEDVDWSRFPELRRWRERFEQNLDTGLAAIESSRTMEEYQRAAKQLTTAEIPFQEMSRFRHETAVAKLPACLRYTDEILASGLESLVIFAHHTDDVLKKIHEHYGAESCVIYGDTPPPKRMPIVHAFQEGKVRIFIGGLRAAGTGITLTRAWTAVFFESDWNPSVMRQAEDRLCRIGQKKMVQIIHPVLNGSLDANMVKVVLAKQRVVDRIVDQLPEDSLRRK